MISGVKSEWDIYVPVAQFALNLKAKALHGSTPFSLMFGRRDNALENYEDVDSNGMITEDDLKTRLNFLTKIVYPAINERGRKAQGKLIKGNFNATPQNLSATPLYVTL